VFNFLLRPHLISHLLAEEAFVPLLDLREGGAYHVPTHTENRRQLLLRRSVGFSLGEVIGGEDVVPPPAVVVTALLMRAQVPFHGRQHLGPPLPVEHLVRIRSRSGFVRPVLVAHYCVPDG
jgi:hypothetical protein